MTELQSADVPAVARAYGSAAAEYIERFGSADRAAPEERALIADWAHGLSGPVLDAGCGPGHWSAFLQAQGLEVEGVDATPEFVQHAMRTYPDIGFRLADLREVPLPDASLGGVLAWFSLIHAEPQDAAAILRALAAALRPGGRLLVGFFTGDRLAPFDHRVVTGWTWPVTEMTAAMEAAGLTVLATHALPAPVGRRYAALTACRTQRRARWSRGGAAGITPA